MGNTVDLSVGDIVHDAMNGDVGIVLSQHIERGAHSQGNFFIVVWRIYWISEGDTRYTEEGILNMLSCGALVHYKNI